MANKAYFLSDLHLGSSAEPNAFLLINFLKSITHQTQASHIFLLGDIFDLWVADHNYFIEKYAPILEELKRLKKLGVEIHYFEGNHDLYLEYYFARELQFVVHKQAQYFNLFNRVIRIEHGDQMDPEDIGYLRLRAFLRTRLMNWLAPRLPGHFVAWLGEKMSAASRHYTSHVKPITNERIRSMILAHVQRAYAEQKFDMHISGHVHVVVDEIIKLEKEVHVINLGSWLDSPKLFYMTSDAGGFINLNSQ